MGTLGAYQVAVFSTEDAPCMCVAWTCVLIHHPKGVRMNLTLNLQQQQQCEKIILDDSYAFTH